MSNRLDSLVLSSDAAELLLEAAADPRGAADFIPSEQGCSLYANRREFIEPRDVRSEARWKAALTELVDAGLMEIDGVRCSVTNDGFQLAARLRRG